MCSGSLDIFKYCEIGDNISETVHDRDMVASYVSYQMLPLPVTVNGLEGDYCCLKPL